MQYPGQWVQIDVKYVSSVCLVGDVAEKKFINTLSSMDTADFVI